ncbi:MAG: hypothetical protein HYU36_17465 [Planctomycetes bacterium]|nr:hypothetical protein [Planctomycetota bacterium]
MPDFDTVAAAGLPAVLWTLFAATLVGHLKNRYKIPTPYTRKIFHVLIFSAAGVFHAFYQTRGVAFFGIVVSLGVLYAVWKGDRFPFYEAMARPGDHPHRSFFILLPLATTALGGVLSNLLFPNSAAIGYLVCGWGDAAGEPVGSRWGRHPYRVPSLLGVPARRSLEGSLAVWLCGSTAAAIALGFSGLPLAQAVGLGLLCGLAGASAEAVSNHGLDNLTVQLAASAAASFLVNRAEPAWLISPG